MGRHPGDFLSSLPWKCMTLKDLLDTRLPSSKPEIASEIFKVITAAVQCLEPNPSRRPTMQHVTQIFSKAEAPITLDYLHTEFVVPA